MKMLGFASPKAQYRSHSDEIKAAINRVLDGDVYIQGPAHDAFEKDFAVYLGAAHAVGVGNGTDALVLALMAAGLGNGDRVVVPSHTAAATISAVRRVGAIPVFVDVDPRTYTMPLAAAEAAVPGAKAIILVHLYGYPADSAAFRAMAQAHGAVLIEDCAQATGADLHGRRLGTIGHVGCFSFFPTKNLGAIGDGGAVVTNDGDLAARLRQLRTYGWNDERLCLSDGMNSRLDELQAAILGVKLPFLDRDNERRRQIASRYRAGLKHLPLELPAESPAGRHVYHLFVVALDRRDELRSHLQVAGVATGIHYMPPNHHHPVFAKFAASPLPKTERLALRILSLPIYPEITDGEVDSVVTAIAAFFDRQS